MLQRGLGWGEDRGLQRMRAISLAYHDVVEGGPLRGTGVRPGIALYTVTRTAFREQLTAIRKENVLIDVIRRFDRWDNRSPTFLTFDDGAQNACTAAEELEAFGWRGHFFITSNWIGGTGFLNAPQIRALHRRGHVIGSHSCSHPERMSRLSAQELIREWSDSCAVLGEILGEAVKVGSVPDGYYSRKVGQAAAAAGIEVLFTSEATSSATAVDGCLILGRYFIRQNTTAAGAAAIAGGWRWPRWRQSVLWQGKKAVKAMTGESYLTVRRFLISKVLPKPRAVSGV